VESPVDEKEFSGIRNQELTDMVYEQVYKNYLAKRERIAQQSYPIIKNVFENETKYENIAIPVSDGLRQMTVVANIKKAYDDQGREIPLAIEKGITLSLIDNAWKEHLREMDDLKQSVQNAAYEQKDPLLIYKFESFQLFKNMVQKTNKDIISFMLKGNIPIFEQENIQEARVPKHSDRSRFKEERSDLLSQAHSNTQNHQKTQPVKVEKKVGRNDPCPCGSGKKYKNCHGIGQ